MRSIHTVTAIDQAENRYKHIRFTVEPGCCSILVRLDRGDAQGLVLDLGLAGPDGLRGWSGGARGEFAISVDDATPGYQPGLPPGEWHVIVGLHRVPTSATFTITITTNEDLTIDHGPAPEPVVPAFRGSQRDLPAGSGLRWYAGDPHNHSIHSDGSLSLPELATEGLLSGLDFLGVTEHNTVSHHRFLRGLSLEYGITLIPGQEVTTHLGHANAWGRIGVVDFRQPGNTWASQARVNGGFLTINHPISDDCSWLYDSRDVDGIEIFHSTWYKQLRETSILAWHALFSQLSVPRTLIGGGDFHRPNTPLRPGLPTTWVAARDNSEEAILEGMRLGRTAITGSYTVVSDSEWRPELRHAPILLRDGAIMHAVDADECVVVDMHGTSRVVTSNHEEFTAPVDRGPYRIERGGNIVAVTS